MTTRGERERAVAQALAFLQDGYNLQADVEWKHHPRLAVHRDGRRYSFTVNPHNADWFALKRQDIVRVLGPPSGTVPEGKGRSLEEMTMQLEAKAAQHYAAAATPPEAEVPKPVGRILAACYTSGISKTPQLSLYLDGEAVLWFPSGRLTVRADRDVFVLRDNPQSSIGLHPAERHNIALGGETWRARVAGLTGLTLFSRVAPTQVVPLESGDGLRVQVPFDRRVRVPKPSRGPTKAEQKLLQPLSKEDKLPLPTTVPIAVADGGGQTLCSPAATAMRTVLKEIRRIERDTGYRFGKYSRSVGAAPQWGWRAPSIFLDDDNDNDANSIQKA